VCAAPPPPRARCVVLCLLVVWRRKHPSARPYAQALAPLHQRSRCALPKHCASTRVRVW
jgi:hypothetical protein